MDAQRALLDQLMGIDRNRALDEMPTRKRHWSDEDTCPYYLCGYCPYDLFVNTKSDLGECGFVHDNAVREDFLKESEEKQRHTKYRFLRRLQRLVEDLEFRIRDGKRRIELPNPGDIQAAEKAAKQLTSVNAEIEQNYARMENLGEEGKVVESKALMNIVKELERARDGLKRKVDAVKVPDDSDRPYPTGVAPLGDGREKRMRVCDICGAFLVINDAANRVESHLEGKQHVGYARIRGTIEELKKINFSPDDMRPPSSRLQQRDPSDRSSRHRSSRDRSSRRRSSRDRSSHRSSRRRRRSRSSSTKKDDDGDSSDGGADATENGVDGSDKGENDGDKKSKRSSSRHRSSKRRRSRSRDRHRSSRHRSRDRRRRRRSRS